jgi:CubicO group peptidase (beta-lactamase class C family)
VLTLQASRKWQITNTTTILYNDIMPVMKNFLFFILTAYSSHSFAQGSTDIASKLDDYLKSANEAYRFNGAGLVVHNGEVLLNKGYGFSDMKSKTPNTADTRFPLLSITKTFTATIILKLQDEKKLSVNEKLSKYFADYPNGSKITIHHLLTHSSGIHNYSDDVGEEDSAIVNHAISKDLVMSRFKDKPLDFAPGKEYSYNNSGFYLLGLIIEKVTGKPYETVVRDYIFNPLEMTESGFDFNGVPKAIKAQGYQFWDREKIVPYKHFDSTYAYSAGSIYSTTNDMLKWAGAVSAKQILSPETWELAFKPKIQNYGYGWQTGQFFGRKYVKHSGGYPGYMSEFIFYPNENLSIVLLNNFGNYGQNVWAIGMGISSIVFGLPYDNWKLRNETAFDEKLLKSHIGTYANGKNKFEIKFHDHQLYILIPAMPEMQLHAESDYSFFLKDFNTSFHFETDAVVVHEHGQDSRWAKKK